MIREECVLDAIQVRIGLDFHLWIVKHRGRLALEARDNAVSTQSAKDAILRKGRKRRVRVPKNP